MNKNVSNKITVINFIMTLLVCNYHFRFWEFGYNSKFTSLREFSGFLAMAVFFMISGYLLFQNANTQEDIKRKIHSRAYSLLLPFFIWNLISTIIFAIEAKTINLTFTNLINHFFCGPSNGPIWYLMAIYLLSLFSPLIIKIKDNKKIVTSLFLSIIAFLYLRSIGLIPYFFKAESWWWYWNMLGYLPYYLIGAYAGLYFKDFISKPNYKKSIYIISFICFLILLFVRHMISKYEEIYIIPKYIYYFINISLVVLFWFAIPHNWFKTNLNPITQTSFFIYVMHYPILIPMAYKIIKPIYKNYISKLYQFLILYCFSISLMFIICLTIVTLLKLIFIKWTKPFMILSGNRVKNDFSIKLENKKKNSISNNFNKQKE